MQMTSNKIYAHNGQTWSELARGMANEEICNLLECEIDDLPRVEMVVLENVESRKIAVTLGALASDFLEL